MGSEQSQRPHVPSRDIEEAMTVEETNLSTKTFIVYRGAVLPGNERFVNVREGGQLWKHIDPQAMVKSITKRERSRHACIVSFIAGLRASGAKVIVEDRRYFREPRRYEFTSAPCELDRVYFTLGLLFARSEHGLFRRTIVQESDLDKREKLLIQAADLYWKHENYPVFKSRLQYRLALKIEEAKATKTS
jgi:hypothetical protein